MKITRKTLHALGKFRSPFARRDPASDWKEVQSGRETPEMRFMRNNLALKRDRLNPEDTYASSKEVSDETSNKLGNSQISGHGEVPTHSFSGIFRPKNKSGIAQSHDDLSHNQEKEIQRRLDKARKELKRTGLMNSLSRHD